MHISPYKYGNIFNVDETRDRKLLLHKLEIFRLHQKVKLKGYTLIPVRMYLKDGRAKLEIALARVKTYMTSVKRKNYAMQNVQWKRH